MTEELTEAQEAAFDRLIESGGDSNWVPAKEVGHPQSIAALERRNVIQTKDQDGVTMVALAGVLLDEEVAHAARAEESDSEEE